MSPGFQCKRARFREREVRIVADTILFTGRYDGASVGTTEVSGVDDADGPTVNMVNLVSTSRASSELPILPAPSSYLLGLEQEGGGWYCHHLTWGLVAKQVHA